MTIEALTPTGPKSERRQTMIFRVLDDEGVKGIHEAAVGMLATIGMKVGGEDARRALLDAGGKEKEGRVYLSGEMVETALEAVPKGGFEVSGREGGNRIRIAPGELAFRPAGGLPFTTEYPGERRRVATMADGERIVRVVEGLAEIAITNSAVSPAADGVGIRNVRRFANAVRYSRKPTDITASGADEVAAVHEIAVALRGSRAALERDPLVVVYVSPTSPLRLSEGEGRAVLACAERGLPLALLSCPTLAATAPATLAGGVAQQWAEELAMLVLAYTVRPGLPVVACSRLNPMDMRGGNTVVSGAAPGLATAAGAEVAAHFGMPMNGWGFGTSSHSADLQAGAERMTGALLAAMSGTSVISGAGTLDNALASAPEQLVIDNELAQIVRQVVKGVEVSEETLASAFLAEGVSEGTFLASEHTVRHLRDGEMWMPDLFSSEPFQRWEQERKDLMDRAHARVEEILAKGEAVELESDKLAEVERILKAAGA